MTPPPKFLLALAGAFLTLNVLDVLTTEYALRTGHRELNPVMKAGMNRLGRPAIYGMKMGTVTYIAAGLNPLTLMFGTAIMVGVVTSNLLQLAAPSDIVEQWRALKVTPSASAPGSQPSTATSARLPNRPSASSASVSGSISLSTKPKAATPSSPEPAAP